MSRFPRDIQNTVDDLPIDGLKLFCESTDESVHTLKDFRATLRSWHLHTCQIRGNLVALKQHKDSDWFNFLPIVDLQNHLKRGQAFKRKDLLPWLLSLPTHCLRPNVNFDGLVRDLEHLRFVNLQLPQPTHLPLFRAGLSHITCIGTNYIGQMDSGSCNLRLLHLFYLHSFLSHPSLSSSSSQRSVLGSFAETGSHLSPMHRGHRNSSSPVQGEGILFKVLSGPQKEWGMETNIISQTHKHLCEIKEFQDGDSHSYNSVTGFWVLVRSPWPSGCIFSHHNSPVTRGFFILQLTRITTSRECFLLSSPAPECSQRSWQVVAVHLWQLGVIIFLYLNDWLFKGPLYDEVPSTVQNTYSTG